MTVKSVNSNSQIEIENGVISLLSNYLNKEHGEGAIEIPRKGKVGGNGRYILKPIPRNGNGKYGRVSFFEIHDKRTTDDYKLVVKRNREDKISKEDAIEVTKWEAEILQIFSERDDVVSYCGHHENLLLMESLDGITLEEYINEQRQKPPDKNQLTYENLLPLVDSMLKIDFALTDIVEQNKDMKNFWSGRRYRLLAAELKREPPDLRDNFYSYRIIEAGNISEPEVFIKTYSPINQTLMNAKKLWVSFDRPQNRIVVSYGPPLNNVRYDFNHIDKKYIGSDLAMHLGIICSFSKEDVPTTINLANLVVLEQYKREIEGRLGRTHIKQEVNQKIAELRDPEKASKVISVREFYDNYDVMKDFVCMHASFLHRNILDMFRAASEYLGTRDINKVYRVKGHFEALNPICSLSQRFLSNLSQAQRSDLERKGYRLITNPAQITAQLAPALYRMIPNLDKITKAQ